MLKFNLVSYYMGMMMFISSLVGLGLGLTFYFSMKVIFIEWEIFDLFGSLIIMTLLMDWMSLTFMGLVSLISSMVLIYSTYYMMGDKFIYRFIMLVCLFVLSMMLMIISPNLISILLGWDGLGLVSYCLVIYYQNIKSANAGMLTILSNRVGDVAILLGISWLSNFSSWNFYYLGLINPQENLMFVMWMMILAAMTKSAQIPFSAWLPAAMAAPTPVSALVHSSTLVTAGVYLLIRFSPILNINSFIFFVGTMTMFMSGLGANFETDLKKIIALSTLSQLGVMMMILGLGFMELSFFHLLSHALFKSLLFLCAGVYIHSVGDIQDIRLMGGFWRELPVSSVYFMGCSLSLCGFPFLSGFYSKDLILEVYQLEYMNLFMILIILTGTFFTVSYSVRLGYFLFWKNMGVKSINMIGEEKGMIYCMSVLFVLAISAGSAMSWIYFPALYIFLPFVFKIMILLGVFMTTIYMYINVSLLGLMGLRMSKIKHFLGGMWFMPFISVLFFINYIKQGKILHKICDQGWYEYLGGQGTIYYFSNNSILDNQNFLSMKNYIWFFFLMIVILMMMLG